MDNHVDRSRKADRSGSVPSVDQFQMFNNGASIGLTSAPTPGWLATTISAALLADRAYSRGIFLLGAGDHSFTGAQLPEFLARPHSR